MITENLVDFIVAVTWKSIKTNKLA